MTRDSRATRRSQTLIVIVCALVFTCSCVKLPRKYAPFTGDVHVNQESPPAPLIDINTASPEELEKLPGIGRGLAARIAAHREQYGRFRRVEHLIMVRGIGERRFRRMRAFIRAG
jgi:competence ComEA-like helix-hairpin-helix protein